MTINGSAPAYTLPIRHYRPSGLPGSLDQPCPDGLARLHRLFNLLVCCSFIRLTNQVLLTDSDY